jgi:ABC-type antimicrobial peptide transport system ATPase subunit
MAKKYSRVVRKLAATLIGWNVPWHFRQRVCGNVGEEDSYQDVQLVDIIERTLQGETISKREVENMRALLKQAEERLTERNATIAKLLHNGINLAAELRTEREQHIQDTERMVEALNQNMSLRFDNLKLMASQVVHFADELIEPPACLKPKDALDYINSHTYHYS